ncbi:MAG: DUF4156 domain-containing protein [Nitrosomonas sp.]|nr:DUF4156 domain-containing protein [Nitrosomonas sp.]
MNKIIVLCCFVLLTACATWVKVTPQGETVRIIQSIQEVKSCKRLGKVNAKVVSKFIFERDKEKVAAELANLARNEASVLGGDTIVPISEIYEGRRTFVVYQCFQPERDTIR